MCIAAQVNAYGKEGASPRMWLSTAIVQGRDKTVLAPSLTARTFLNNPYM